MCLIALVGVFVLYKFVGSLPQNNKAVNQSVEKNALTTQTSTEGAVTVKATPKTLASGSEAIFEVVFDTHSVELSYDLMQIASMTDDIGNTYQPVSWTGGRGGHHLEGVITFPMIANSTSKVTMTIPDIDNKDRIFEWNLK